MRALTATPEPRWAWTSLPAFVASLFIALLAGLSLAPAWGDLPGRNVPAGTAPEPGAQQQELPNITFPAPYNIFEFVVTCMACHGGVIDQQAAHGGNWAGSNHASATRDPIFRANQVLVNSTLKNSGAGDGGGNWCFRCHSPNTWLSGRAEPTLGSSADGSDLIHSIVLSTDDEGVSCEMCHRAIGGVTFQRPDLNPIGPVWNLMSGLFDWPHQGSSRSEGPTEGNPYGNGTIQYHDGMSYGAKYGGIVELSFSDYPLTFTGSTDNYTGQTYGIYPWWYTGPIQPPPPGLPATNDLGDVIEYTYDGSITYQTEVAVTADAWWGAVSPEHGTRKSDFVMSPELCGSCHEVTVSVLNHGMPEQRTYTEWKYSSFGREFDPVSGDPNPSYRRCQDCHMPTMKHEFADDAPVSLNPDPTVSGWYPYSKDRNIGGGTAFHKFNGGNRNLPEMMKILYPEIDLEVIGASTGHDPRIFPGMLSDRGPMFDRARRNTEIALRDAVSVAITQGPTLNAANRWEVKVRVTNHGGHKLPSGFPEGHRMWVGLTVKDAGGATVYESGHYDDATARLYSDASMADLTRALTPSIDASANAVMIYEKATCNDTDDDGACDTTDPSLLNNKTLFDNRIPPAGFSAADYSANGAKFWTYDPTTLVPAEDMTRYPDGQNWDEITYTFDADPGAPLTARAEVYYQSHTREYMDFLNQSLAALPAADQGPRPQGPPNILDPNYPLTPTYLSDSLEQTTGVELATLTDLDGAPLLDNWGGIAYAGWLLTGKGAPYSIGAADTAVVSPPADAPTVSVAQGVDPITGLTDPVVQIIGWTPVDGADGYLVRIRYGADPATSDWDKLAVVHAPTVELRNEALNVAKTYVYTVQAYNAAGYGPESAETIAQTPIDLPLPPINTKVVSVTDTTATLAWYDQADNEDGFIIEWQPVPLDVNAILPEWTFRAMIDSITAGGAFGGNNWTDTGLEPGRTYNYRVKAFNADGTSVPDLPVAATTLGLPPAPSNLVATAISGQQVDLTWQDNAGAETGFRLERATDAVFGAGYTIISLPANTTAYSDLTVSPSTTYYYRVSAFNVYGFSAPSNTVSVTTQDQPPLAPSNLVATASDPSPNPPTVTLTWTDNATTETGFTIERATDAAFTVGLATFTTAADTTSLLDTTVEPKVTYYYRVRAFNAAGASLWSNTASVVTPGEVPESPADLVVTKVSKNSVDLAWLDKSTNELGFYLERSTDGGVTWTRIATLPANTRKYKDKGLTTRSSYWYRVQAYNADGVSGYSNTVLARTR